MADGNSSPPWRARPHLELPALLGLVVLINLPYFRPAFFPAHDTRYVFGVFSYFYNHLLVEHELPRWMAYGTFGFKSALFQFDFLSPSSYVFMVGGALLGVRDPLLVFTLSILGEQLLFLLGVHLLARRLFADRLTALLVSVAGACTTVWYWQIFLNFRWFHLLPLTLYFLHRFTSEKRPEFLWMTGISFLLGTLGCPPYVYPLLGLTLLGFALALGSTFRSALPCLRERSWRNGLGLGLLALTFAAVGLTLHQALDGIRLDAAGRDAESGSVPFMGFLRHGGLPSADLLRSYLGALPDPGGGANRELTHYLGLLPLVALPVALVRCRHPYFIALLVTAGLLHLFSLGGTFAALVYQVPLMNLFRHVGYATSIAKVLLLLASGFGIEALLSDADSGIRRDRRARFGAIAVAALVLWIFLDVQIGVDLLIHAATAAVRGGFALHKFWEPLHGLALAGVGLATAAVALWPARGAGLESRFSAATLRKVLLGAVLLDGLLYQADVSAQMPVTDRPVPIPVGAVAFRERRGDAFDPPVAETLREWKRLQGDSCNYHLSICSLFQIDPDRPVGREDYFSRPVLSLREHAKTEASLGTGAPKLHLVSRAVYVETEAEAARAVSGPAEGVVLRGVPPELRFDAPAAAAGEIRVKGFSANRLEAEVQVASPHPVWLVYADSFHPGWSATVNGKAAPVAEASLAFKAVRLEPGANAVRFAFHDGIHTVAAQLMAVLGFLFGAGALGAFAALAIRREPLPKADGKR